MSSFSLFLLILYSIMEKLEAVSLRCSVKKAFLTISQNLQEAPVFESFLMKLDVSDPQLY